MTDSDLAGRYVFLASHAYSGSTLLSFLLGAHPEIGTVSDVSGRRRRRMMETFECSCGRLMTACPFWEQLMAVLAASGLEFSLDDFELGFDHRHPRWLGNLRVRSLGGELRERIRDAAFGVIPGEAARMEEIGVRNAVFARAVLEVTGSRIFVDASKERLRAQYLRRYVDPMLRVIHLIRDPRGVADSTRRRGKLTSFEQAGTRWARTNAAIARSLSGLDGARRLTVRYEDLCSDPDSEMRRIFTFCGIEPSVNVTSQLDVEQHLLGNSMRLKGVGDIRHDERWRASLGDADRQAVEAAAGSWFTNLYRSGTADRQAAS
jgi:hypothetical protein